MTFLKTLKSIIHEKIEKQLIVFDDMIDDMLSDKKLNPVVTTLFIRGRKLNISFLFISQSYLNLPKNIRLSSMDYSIMKTSNKREHQKIEFNLFSFLLIATTFASDNSSHFRILERI